MASDSALSTKVNVVARPESDFASVRGLYFINSLIFAKSRCISSSLLTALCV